MAGTRPVGKLRQKLQRKHEKNKKKKEKKKKKDKKKKKKRGEKKHNNDQSAHLPWDLQVTYVKKKRKIKKARASRPAGDVRQKGKQTANYARKEKKKRKVPRMPGKRKKGKKEESKKNAKVRNLSLLFRVSGSVQVDHRMCSLTSSTEHIPFLKVL